MGVWRSRQQQRGPERPNTPSGPGYSFPPKAGCYFASHFIMGGEKFDSTHPEGYLFGENTDLNFLGSRPVAFPYAAPPPQEPVKTLRSLVNIRKDTLRLVKCTEEVKLGEEDPRPRLCYNVEFTFDADARVAITIYYQATEEFQSGCAIYTARERLLQSETVHYKRGMCQSFCLPSHTVQPSQWVEEELGYDGDRDIYPAVIQAVVAEGDEHVGHSHVLLATFDKHVDGSFSLKPLKQKQEIYGIENKYNSQESKVTDDEVSDNSAECVVCLSDVRDTLILPCRHLCLCNACADTLRYQANNCPICRLPFRALLQIRAMRKKLGPLSPTSYNPVIASQVSDSEEHSSDHIPPGYEAVSLLEALNGPLTPSPSVPGPVIGDVLGRCVLPAYSTDRHSLPGHTLSPLDRMSDSGNHILKLKKSTSKSLSQNSSMLREEDEEKSFSESEIQASPRKVSGQDPEECGVTPESENLTFSSSGAVEPSSCTGTPLSSTITSPEDPVSSSLPQSVMSMASSQSQNSQISTDTLSSMSGSYVAGGREEFEDVGEAVAERLALPEEDKETPPAEATDANFIMTLAEEQDSEGNEFEDEPESSDFEADRTLSTVTAVICDNNNEQSSLTGLDNDPHGEVSLPGTPTSEVSLRHQLSTLNHLEREDSADLQHLYGPVTV